jgi:hypothetical protein
MRRAILILAGLLSSTNLLAAEDPGPIIVIFSDGIGAAPARMESWRSNALLYNAIGDWANASINKKSRANVAAFRAHLKGFDLDTEPAGLLACTAVPDPQAGCRATTYDKDVHRATFVLLTPEWNSEQLMIRAVANDLDERDGLLTPRRQYTALFTTRAPSDVVKSAKKQKGALEAWWLDGAPSRLEAETRRGFSEISALLSRLAVEVGAAGEFPEPWRQLPDVRELERADRVYCGGMNCAKAHRIVRVNEDGRTWITFVNGMTPLPVPADKGTVLASFDAPALEHALNLPIYVQMGVASY